MSVDARELCTYDEPTDEDLLAMELELNPGKRIALAQEIMETVGIGIPVPIKNDTAVKKVTAAASQPEPPLDIRDYQLPNLGAIVDKSTWEFADKANCLGTDTQLFFPKRGDPTDEIKEVCQGCVVREPCLEFALIHTEKYGFWGGLAEKERKRIRTQRRQQSRRVTA